MSDAGHVKNSPFIQRSRSPGRSSGSNGSGGVAIPRNNATRRTGHPESVVPSLAGTAMEDDGQNESDKFSPVVSSDSPGFILPENQITVDLVDRDGSADIGEFLSSTASPLYLSTCFDEFSRHYYTTSVGKESDINIPLVKFGADDCVEPNILLPYYPVLSDWFSTSRKVPEETAHLLSGKIISDTNVLIKLNRCHVKQMSFEPLFGSGCIYAFFNDEATRITETFHFDATPQTTRKHFNNVYNNVERDDPPSNTNQNSDYVGNCVNVGDASSAQAHLHMFNASIPESLNYQDLFLVVQISKVLTSDADKAVAPYSARSPVPEMSKHKDFCERLPKFRQPLALGITKINEGGRFGGLNGSTELCFPLYCQKLCLNDSNVGSAIREIYPVEGTKEYIRMDPLDMEMRISVINLGCDDQMMEQLLQQERFQPKPRANSTKGSSNVSSATAMTESAPAVVNGSPVTFPILAPAHLPSSTAQLQYTPESRTKWQLREPGPQPFVIKQLAPLLPLVTAKSSIDFNQIVRQVKACPENTLFVYPLACDRFKHRNLSIKVQLIEFKKDLPKTLMTTGAHEVLCNLYNTSSISGAAFTSAAYTKVSYHVNKPVLSDEFKIRLPDVLTPRHWIKITVLHVHVRPGKERGSLLNSMGLGNSVAISDKPYTDVGVGFLPVFLSGESLVEDKEHTVSIYGLKEGMDTCTNSSERASTPSQHCSNSGRGTPPAKCYEYSSNITTAVEGIVKIRTRAVTALVSSDKRVQTALKHQPVPLGVLPSSIMSSDVATFVKEKALQTPPKEVKLVQVTQDLVKADPRELSRHFFVLMRQLLRTIIGGTGSYSEIYSNPYKHGHARSQAFLSLVQLFGRIANDGTATATPSAASELSQEKQFLHAYVDYMLDEEVPIVDEEEDAIVVQQPTSHNLGATDEEPSPRGSFSPLRTGNASNASSARASPALPAGARKSVNTTGKETDVAVSVADVDVVIAVPNAVVPKCHSSPASSCSSNDQQCNSAQHRSSPPPAYDTACNTSTTNGKGAPTSTVTAVEQSDADENSSEGGGTEADGDTTTSNSTNTRELAMSRIDSLAEVPPSDLGTLETIIEQANTSPHVSKSPACMKEMTSSAGRRSWGKYITDSLWVSGQLAEVGIAGLNKTSSSEASAAVSAKYLDDIALHVVLQMEKIVIERQLNAAVYTVSSEISYNSDYTNEGYDTNSRASGGRSSSKLDDSSTLVASVVLAGKRFRIPHSATVDAMPFEEERAWFAAIDEGKLYDPNDVVVAQEPTNNSETTSMPLNTTDETGTKARRSNSISVEPFRNEYSKGPGKVFIEPILPVYDSMEGFRSRLGQITDPKLQDLGMATGQYQQWWPWLYEVLVFQWGAAMTITLSSIKLISSNNTQSMIAGYPFDGELRQQADVNPKSPAPDTARSLLTEHCPVLLKMIFKSLAMRIIREGKRPPVILDGQFLSALENLVMLLSVEAATFCCGLWRSRRMVSALADFLRNLFSVACSNQVIKLIRSFFRASRKNKRVEEAELRLQMVEEVGLFDHLVAVNYPYTLDAPLQSFSFRYVSSTIPAGAVYAMGCFTPTGIRGSTIPAPYLLAHTLINEVIVCYRQEERKVKDAALEVIRNLLVRHSYDARYQSVAAQQRVVCMYLPLLRELMKDESRIESLPYDSTERKEVLVIMLYLLQGMPDRILREYVREVSRPPHSGGHGQHSGSSRSRPTTPAATNNTPNHSPRATGHSKAGDYSVGSNGINGTRVISLRKDVANATASTKAYIPKSVMNNLEVINLIMLLHLILDTFELPKVDTLPGSTTPSAPPAGSFTAGTSAGSVAPSPAMTTMSVEQYSQVLAPGVRVEGSSSAVGGLTNMRHNSSTAMNNNNLSGHASTPAKNSKATALYKNLDQRLQNKKAGVASTRRSTTATAPGGSAGGTSANGSGKKADERQWVSYARRMAATEPGTDKYVLRSAISRPQLADAAQSLCASAARTVIHLLLVLFEECPPILSAIPEANVNGEPTFILRDSNIDESMLVGIKNLRVVYFMRVTTSVILHALYCNQEDDVIISMFDAATTVIRKFGAKVFLVSVEDALQDWMRVAFYHCASQNTVVSDTASNFVLYVLRACFHYLGSATLVTNTILAVISDVIEAILDNNQPNIRTYTDEDRILGGLNEAVRKMGQAARDNISVLNTSTTSANSSVNSPRDDGNDSVRSKAHTETRRDDALDRVSHTGIHLTGMSTTSTGHASGSYSSCSSRGSSGRYGLNSADIYGQKAMPRLGPSATAAFCKTVITLMDNLEVILRASADLRRHVSHPVFYDFLGANMLDGPWDERVAMLLHLARFKRRNICAEPAADGKEASRAISGFQLEEVMMHFNEAVEVFDSFKLTRFRMVWLENLAWLHKLNHNKAEGAEIRWRIYQLCRTVEDTWKQQWVPRPPLEWVRRGTLTYEGVTGHGHNVSSSGARRPSAPASLENAYTAAAAGGGNVAKKVTGRNFFSVFLTALDSKPHRAWVNYAQYLTHIQSALTVCTEEFCAVNLIHLAERSSFKLVNLYRVLRKPERMLQEYSRISGAVKTVADKGLTSSMAIGTFYRVLYVGLGVPQHLRSKEFIFRNANHVHVAEFKQQVTSHLKSIVENGVEVVIVQDFAAAKDANNTKIAYIIMNSVKLIMDQSTKLSIRAMNNPNGITKRPTSFSNRADYSDDSAAGVAMEKMNQVQQFQYSSPFTLTGKAHAKKIDEQWMRTTILRVKESFPYIMTRQLVMEREIRTYCPIEVAINDIEERIESMEAELEVVVKNMSDSNNLMRIIQGTVLPQVNAGAGEVARVFLSSSRILSDNVKQLLQREKSKRWQSVDVTDAAAASAALEGVHTAEDTDAAGAVVEGNVEVTGTPADDTAILEATEQEVAMQERKSKELVLRLKLTLIDFLSCSKLLLQKSRRVLIDRNDNTDEAISSTTGQSNTGGQNSAGSGNNRASTGSGGNSGSSSGVEGDTLSREMQQFVTWQTEMEKGFEALVQSILPYIQDLQDSDVFLPLAGNKSTS